eukprot:15479823-Alexandrium_andersonii.AAC.1
MHCHVAEASHDSPHSGLAFVLFQKCSWVPHGGCRSGAMAPRPHSLLALAGDMWLARVSAVVR